MYKCKSNAKSYFLLEKPENSPVMDCCHCNRPSCCPSHLTSNPTASRCWLIVAAHHRFWQFSTCCQCVCFPGAGQLLLLTGHLSLMPLLYAALQLAPPSVSCHQFACDISVTHNHSCWWLLLSNWIVACDLSSIIFIIAVICHQHCYLSLMLLLYAALQLAPPSFSCHQFACDISVTHNCSCWWLLLSTGLRCDLSSIIFITAVVIIIGVKSFFILRDFLYFSQVSILIEAVAI